MTGDDGAALIQATLCLVLVGSALAARRQPIRQSLKMASAWLLIFAAGFAIFALRDDFRGLGRRMKAAIDPEAGMVSGGALRIPVASDGHYWVRGHVNGVETRFLIDSGATTTALSDATIAKARVTLDGGFPVVLSTANGNVRAERATIARLDVGPIRATNVAAVTAEAFGDTNVLGMNFLSSLRGWGVEDGTLVLRP